MLAVIGPIRSLPTACMLAWLFKLSVNSKEFLLLEAEVSRFSLPENTTRWPEQVCGSGDTNRYTTCKELAAWFNQRRTVYTKKMPETVRLQRGKQKKNRFDPPQYRFCKSLEVCWSNISQIFPNWVFGTELKQPLVKNDANTEVPKVVIFEWPF